MNQEEENAFVAAFILPAKQDRYRQLLHSAKLRSKMLDRFNHRLDFIQSLATRVPTEMNTSEGIENLLRQRGAGDQCYLISDHNDLDGQALPLAEGVTAARRAYFATVVCCLPGRLAYYKPESPATGYILEKSLHSAG